MKLNSSTTRPSTGGMSSLPRYCHLIAGCVKLTGALNRQGGIVLIAETVSLGILSLPSVLATLGLGPGIALILVMSFLSTYSGLMLAEFHKEFPFVQNFGDALEVIGKSIGMGPLFQEVFGWAQVLFQVFVMGGHLQLWTICLNTLTGSSTCTIAWAVVGLAVFWILDVPRTLRYTSYMSIACKPLPPLDLAELQSLNSAQACLSITVAVLMTLGDVVAERPMGSAGIVAAQELKFTNAFLAVTNIATAFCKSHVSSHHALLPSTPGIHRVFQEPR